VLHSSQDHLGTEMRDLDHPILVGVENIDSWHARKGNLQCAFPLDVPMVPSYPITTAVSNEYLSCVGFDLGETIRFWSLKFIAYYFGGLSLSSRRDDSDAAPWAQPTTGHHPCCGP
jgi:hypothetical protein